jgi:hypothetical protein
MRDKEPADADAAVINVLVRFQINEEIKHIGRD